MSPSINTVIVLYNCFLLATQTTPYSNLVGQKTAAGRGDWPMHKQMHNLSKHAYSLQNNYCLQNRGKYTQADTMTCAQESNNCQ